MCKIYGYCRVSTPKQNIEAQRRNIQESFPSADIRKEIYTGTKYQGREELKKILDKVQRGDTIVFDSVSRMSRNAEDGINLYFDLYNKGVNLVFLKERHIDTDAYNKALESTGIKVDQADGTAEGTLVNEILVAINKFMRTKASDDIIKAFEQAEKEVIDKRRWTRDGLETARIKHDGKICGTVNKGKTYSVKKSEQAKEIIKKHSKSFGGTLGNAEIMKLAGITEPTLLKYKKEIRQEKIENGEMETAN